MEMARFFFAAWPTHSAPDGAGTAAWYLLFTTAMLEPQTDGQLVRRIASSSDGAASARDAECELCRRFAPRIRLYGLRHLGDADRARDLIQSVLLVLLEAVRAGRVEQPERLDRFVLGTCRNVASHVRRTDARARPVEAEELDVRWLAPDAERIETVALLHCIAELEARARAVVHMSFNEERSADEISVLLGTTPGNVRVLRHRAIAQLRSCLDGAGKHSKSAPKEQV